MLVLSILLSYKSICGSFEVKYIWLVIIEGTLLYIISWLFGFLFRWIQCLMLAYFETLFQDQKGYNHSLRKPNFSSKETLLFIDLPIQLFLLHFYSLVLRQLYQYLSEFPFDWDDPCDLRFLFVRCRGIDLCFFWEDGYLRSMDLCRGIYIHVKMKIRWAHLILAMGAGKGWNGRTYWMPSRKHLHLILIIHYPFIIKSIKVFYKNKSLNIYFWLERHSIY